MKKINISSNEDYLFFVEQVREHNRHYYEENKPVISDYEYDQLVKAIEKYERTHPDQILVDSPTKRVGEATTRGFSQKKHVSPMLSLSNTYSEKEIEDFVKRVYKLLERDDVLFCVELKMDGTAVSVKYEKGRFVRALTRGNGVVGDDVTANIKTVRKLPEQIKGKDLPDLLEVRGEVFMHKPIFRQLNLEREEKGLEPWANPRNAAAGSLKLLDSKEVAKRHLDIILYGLAQEEETISSQFSLHKILKKWQLPVSDEKYFAKCSSTKDILSFAKSIQEQRDKLSFEIDGIVIKVDDMVFHRKLGVTGKNPRYAVAYKFAPEQATTKINDITIQVGRTGVLTPVAELEPVHLAGSTISRATLHNQDEIERKDIRIGDWVVIEKGGDVIPKVVSVIKDKREKNVKYFTIPSQCPVCETKVVRKEGEVAVRCPNPKCSARRLQHIIFFAGKQAMDIEHLGKKVVEKLVEKGFISTVSDIFALDQNTLSHLEGFKEKSISNLLKSIELSKKCSLTQFIMGLEIPYVGKETADLLAKQFRSIFKLEKASKKSLIDIEGIGDKVAQSIVEYFHEKKHLDEIEKLLDLGVLPKAPSTQISTSHPFYKKIFVLTGSLTNYTRQEASGLIKQKGGKVSSSVSSQTDYVLVGKNPGSKYCKAKKLGIKILSEEEFTQML